MADWEDLHGGGTQDFLAYYASKTSATIGMPGDLEDIFSSPTLSYEKFPATTFCTADNLEQCVTFLNQELQVLGCPCIKTEGGVPNSVSMCNRLYEVIRLHQKTNKRKEELENGVHRLSAEVERCGGVVARSKRQQEQLERELDQSREKLRQATSRIASLTSRHKAEKEEVKRLQSVLGHQSVQSKHELKKKEREIHRFKEKLHQLLMDKNPDRKVGMDMMSAIHRTEGRRATWNTAGNTGRTNEEMYQLVISNYEERQRELALENSELRECLLSLEREWCSLIKYCSCLNASLLISSTHQPSPRDNSTSDEDDDSSGKTETFKIEELSEGYFQMPYDMVKREVEKRFKDTCQLLRQSFESALTLNGSVSSNNSLKPCPDPKPAGPDLSRENDVLQKQLEKCKEIIQQQEELIQQSLSSQSQSVEESFLHQTQLLQEKKSLAEERRLFQQERQHFQEERRLFTEAAIRLGRERKQFQEEKAKLLKEQFSSLTPFQKPLSKTADGACAASEGSAAPTEHARLLPATPVFSPKPGGETLASPTTLQLYKLLGLAPKSKGGGPSRKQLTKAASEESIQPSASRRSSASSRRSLSSSQSSPASFQKFSAEELDALKMALFASSAKPPPSAATVATAETDEDDNQS